MSVESSSHEVFISYSSRDKKWADAACAVLESRRIRCWIAPRDITPGREWGAALIEGIDACKIMVLIFSGHANESPQVRREVERVISKGRPVLPFRVEDIAPAGAMEYALSNTHWLDGFSPPVERHLDLLASAVERLLARDGPGGGMVVTMGVLVPSRPRKSRRSLAVGGIILGLLLVAGLIYAMSGGKPAATQASPVDPMTDVDRIQGDWEVVHLRRPRGAEIPAESPAKNKEVWKIRGADWEYIKATESGTKTLTGKIVLRQTPGGNLIDVKATADDDRDFFLVGFYKFEDDLLKVSYRVALGENSVAKRAESFDPREGLYMELKKVAGAGRGRRLASKKANRLDPTEASGP